jgi:hypothetical protein
MVLIDSGAHSEQGKEFKCDIKPRLARNLEVSKVNGFPRV